jgi:hypothetical protein
MAEGLNEPAVSDSLTLEEQRLIELPAVVAGARATACRFWLDLSDIDAWIEDHKVRA